MNSLPPTETITIPHVHLFCGAGGGAQGFNNAHVRFGRMSARFECLGGVDIDPDACATFERLVGAPAHVRDLFDRAAFIDYHAQCKPGWHGVPAPRGKKAKKSKKAQRAPKCDQCNNTGVPPEGWEEVTVESLRALFGGREPWVVFGSSPCRSLTGLVSDAKAESPRGRALTSMVFRQLQLAIAAWEPAVILIENVPGLAGKRGRPELDRMHAIAQAAGYLTSEAVHDCGVMGEGLAQNRERFLFIARHREKFHLNGGFVYQPPTSRKKAVGEVIGKLPPPNDPRAGVMHQLSNLAWLTWLRLALIAPGKDWRYLKRYVLGEQGNLRDWRLQPVRLGNPGTIEVYARVPRPGRRLSRARLRKSENRLRVDVGPFAPDVFAVVPSLPLIDTADGPGHVACTLAAPQPTDLYQIPDVAPGRRYMAGVLGVLEAGGAAPCITGRAQPTTGAYAVADPIPSVLPGRGCYHGSLGVIEAAQPAKTITGSASPCTGPFSYADPHPHALIPDVSSGSSWGGKGKYRVTPLDQPAGTVIAESTTGMGAFAVADTHWTIPGLAFRSYGQHAKLRVEDCDGPTHTVTGSLQVGSGALSVAEPIQGLAYAGAYYSNILRVDDWGGPLSCVTTALGPTNGAAIIADPGLGRVAHNNVFRVGSWDAPCPSVTAGSTPTAGGLNIGEPLLAAPIPDMMPERTYHPAAYGVLRAEDTSRTITTNADPGNGAYAYADLPGMGWSIPGLAYGRDLFGASYGVLAPEDVAKTVTSARSVGTGAWSYADTVSIAGVLPERTWRAAGLGVLESSSPSGTVTGDARPTTGAFSYAESAIPSVETGWREVGGLRSGYLGTVDPAAPAPTVTGHASYDNGRWCYPDDPGRCGAWQGLGPRDLLVQQTPRVPAPKQQGQWIIITPWSTYNRPLTSLELAEIQGFRVWDEEAQTAFTFSGSGRTAHRSQIGKAVPPPTAQACAEAIGEAFLRREAGVGFQLTDKTIWVDPQLGALRLALATNHQPLPSALFAPGGLVPSC